MNRYNEFYYYHSSSTDRYGVYQQYQKQYLQQQYQKQQRSHVRVISLLLSPMLLLAVVFVLSILVQPSLSFVVISSKPVALSLSSLISTTSTSLQSQYEQFQPQQLQPIQSKSSTILLIPQRRTTLVSLYAKKNSNKKSSGGEGFGKKKVGSTTDNVDAQQPDSSIDSSSSSSTILQSISTATNENNNNNSNNIPVEERTAMLLREKYGLKTLAEQQMDVKQLELYKQQQQQMKQWKNKLEQAKTSDKEFDIFTILPPAVIVGIDTLLKIGVVVFGLTFITSGIAITIEAYGKATNQPNLLPPDIQSFIVTVIQPNFTTNLLILLGFSIGLGLYAAAQLGSSGSTYREE